MNPTTTWRRALAVAAVLLLASGGAALAQEQTGNLYGVVTDPEGAALPGVRVEVTGVGAPQTQFTDAQGQFRFLNLDPGNYQLTANLEGFSTVEFPDVDIRVGRNTTLEITLSPAVEEVITVTAESPLLDERKVAKGTTVSQIELEKIPTARDPWAIVTQTPGVLSDRINVGGNESGQQ
ncbi:MAG: carboxypeptidase-like regulatory domain-containing protein, partial [bacterium]